MKDISEFFTGLFDTDRWPPRWECGYWSEFHGWLYIASDLMIWLAYFLIPLIIINYFKTKKSSIRFHAVYLLFAAFILLCGTTHFLDAVMFWVPAYRFNAVVRFITGVVSLVTVYQLVLILPGMIKLRTGLELEKEIARREQVERDLAEANRRLNAFASIASHDLQEPLRKIKLLTEMVYSKNQALYDDASKLNTEKVMQSASRMQGLIKSVLTLSSMDNNIEVKNVDTNEAVRLALETLELRIHEKKAAIHINKLPEVMGNLSYLTQLFTNLVNNAIKFNKRTPEIQITGKKIDGVVVIMVSDNGIGMGSESYDKIFQAFQRVHPQSTYEGTGIGLAICRQIMDLHGGSINVISTPDVGTTFTLTFSSPDN